MEFKGAIRQKLKMRRLMFIIIIVSVLSLLCAIPALAGTYTYGNWFVKDRDDSPAGDIVINVMGYNRTHGFATPLNSWVQHTINNHYDTFAQVYYELPDDGSVWDVIGTGYLHQQTYDGNGTYEQAFENISFEQTITTPGTFTGVSIGQAVTAANNAKTSADLAAAYALEASNKANSNFTEIQDLKTRVNSIISTIYNSQSPYFLEISGLNGATCTTTDEFKVVIQAIGADRFRAKADTGEWGGWVEVGKAATALGITGKGAHTVTVEARNDDSGKTATGQITIFKL